jgi:hypothetical protein
VIGFAHAFSLLNPLRLLAPENVHDLEAHGTPGWQVARQNRYQQQDAGNPDECERI